MSTDGTEGPLDVPDDDATGGPAETTEDDEMAEDSGNINFNEVIARSQATTLEGMGKMFGMTADRQSSIFLKKADEIDPVQAAAMRQVASREAPIDRV